MEDRKDKQIVQQVFDSSLSGIQDDPWMAQRVLNMANRKGVSGVRMRNKLSFGMVLLIVLLSLSVTAGAVIAINLFIEHAASLQEEKGSMANWTLDEKIALIVSMKESGIDIPQNQLEQLTTGEISVEEANHIADRLIVEKKHARDALVAQYGFTRTTFSFFSTQVDFVEDKEDASNSYWVVLYTPVVHTERIGHYNVKINAITQEVISVGWEYDAVYTPSEDAANWHAEIWDVELVDGLATFDQEIQTKKTELELTRGEFSTWTLQDKAEFDRVYLDSGYPYGDMPLNVLPEECDLSAEDAVVFAAVCIEGTYGVDRSMLSGFCVKQTLFRIEGAKERLYIIEFHHQSGSEYYAVEFSSETKTVDLCAHYVNQVYIPPQPHTEEEISVKVEPVIPDHLVEDAKEALKEGYGLTDNALRFFDTTVIAVNDGWEIVFKSNTINPRTVGTYTVFYSQAGNCVEKTEWEFDSIYPHQEKQKYWKDNEIWGPHEMNCFAQLRIAGRTIVNEAGGENHMSFEQQAEYDRLYREAGYSRTQYYHGTPGIRDITFEDALSKAKAAVANKWHISQEELDSCDVIYEFDVSDPDQYVWRIRFLIDNGEKMYTVELDSETGNILKRYVGVGTNG